MKVLFKSKNLLGDSLQTTSVIEAFRQKYFPEVIDVLTDKQYAVVFNRIHPTIKSIVISEAEVDEDLYDFVFTFDISRAWRLGVINNIQANVAYGLLLGFDLLPTVPIFNPLQEEVDEAKAYAVECPYVLFQPYSVSCSSWTNEQANKRWTDEAWAETYKKVTQELGIAVRVLGGPKDEKNYLIPGIAVEDHWFGLSLDKVAALQRYAVLVLTLDSGVAHLAASQCAHMLEFYPECLPSRWMSNLSNANGKIIHARPQSLPVDWVWNYVRSEIVLTLAERGSQPCPESSKEMAR